MEIDPSLTQIDFQVALSSFKQQLLGKLDYLNNIQIQLLRKFECSINLPQSHSELVFYLRNLVLLIEQSFKDVSSYFNDLHMNFLYDFFRKIQLLMLNGFNFLSQALVLQLDLNNKQKQPKSMPKQLEVQRLIVVDRTSAVPSLKEQAKQLQHYDYAINFYENQQRKVADELHRMQDNIMLSKGLIDKLHPSKAVKQLEQIKERAQITLQNTQKIFEETYQLKYLEFKQYLSKLHKPQDLTQQFCQSLRVTMKDKFEDGMKKSANLLYNIKKESMLSKMREISVQTDEEPTNKVEKKIAPVPKAGQKLHNLLLKQRKLTQKLLGQLHSSKKQNQILTIDKVNMQNIINQLDTKCFDLIAKYDILSKLYNQKRQQLLLLRKSYQDQLGVISRLKCFQMRFMKEFDPIQKSIQTDGPLRHDKDVQVRFQDNEIISILKRTNEKMGERIRQKQIRLKEIQRKQVTQKKQKVSRLRISQVISTDAILSLIKPQQALMDNSPKRRASTLSSGRRSQSSSTMKKDMEQLTKTVVEPMKRSSARHGRLSQFAGKKLQIQEISYLVQKQDCIRENGVDSYTQTHDICICLQGQKPVKDQQIQVCLTNQQRRATKREAFPQSYNIIDYEQNLSINQSHRTKIFGQPKKRFTILPNGQPQKLAQISNSYFKQAHEMNQLLQPTRTKRQQNTTGYFEKLNIQNQDSRSSLQKRNALARNFIYNMKRKEKQVQKSMDRNITYMGEFLREKLNTEEDSHSSNLINIQRLDCSKRTKIKLKQSNPPKKSRKAPQHKQNQSLSKIKQ